MKQLYMKFLVLLFLFCAVCFTAEAYDCIVDGIYYNLDNTNKTASVTYQRNNSGNYSDNRNAYKGAVIIPSTIIYSGTEYSVTSIGDHAFFGCENVTTVTIPNSIISIESEAFYTCRSLTLVDIPNSVKSIGNSAYSYCSSLTFVKIGNSVESIGSEAFYWCRDISKVSITDLSAWCKINFSGRYSNPLTYANSFELNGHHIWDLVIPSNVESIGSYAFSGYEDLYSVSMPNSVKSIGNGAFSDCIGLFSVEIPNSVTSIGAHVFGGCTNLRSVTIPNSVTSIGGSAFSECKKLTSVTIPNSVTSIGGSAFSNCTGMTSVTIGNSVTSIGSSAFSGCTGLTSVEIPNSVTSIGERAFYDCKGLTSVHIEDLASWCGITFEIGSDYQGNTLYGSNPLYYAHHLYLNGEEIKDLIIPNSVESIGGYAFYSCTGLTSVTIPNSVTSIGSDAFIGCTGLTSINISDLIAWCGIKFKSYGSNPLYYAHHLFLNGKEVKDLVIPNNVESIGNYAFNSCTGLTSVTIPNSVTSIGQNAFSGCTGLTSVTIPNSVTSIGSQAFYGCTGMTSVTIGNSVTSIGSQTFYGCSRLTSVTIGDSVTTISSDAFPSNNNIKFYVNRGTKGLLTLWRYNYVPYDIVTNERLNKPSLSLKRTQTTHTISCPYYYDEYTYTLNNQPLSEGEWVFTNLWPETEYNYNLVVSLDNAKYSETKMFKTDDIYPRVSKISSTASSLTIQGRYNSGDAQVTETWLTIAGSDIDGQTATLTGLNPGNYEAYFSIRVANGPYPKVFTSKKTTISTETLSLVTQQPKVISAGNVIVAAKSNLDDAEENVGFEWRRTDWTDDFASNSGTAYLYEGTMEGYIRNLYTEKLWKYRPFYTSASGRTYYGEWVGIDPTNTSYFEPTVHTYATIEVQGNTAAVRGYAMRGTDNITRQGFMYWPQGASHVGRRDAPSVPSNALTIEATGTVMEAKLTGLSYNTTYSYVAFATTSEGETFYGDERQFTTDIDMSGIEEVEMSSDAATPETWYDLHGRRLSEPRHGINILRMSDGSSRKIFVP